jgi:hypothetical protein
LQAGLFVKGKGPKRRKGNNKKSYEITTLFTGSYSALLPPETGREGHGEELGLVSQHGEHDRQWQATSGMRSLQQFLLFPDEGLNTFLAECHHPDQVGPGKRLPFSRALNLNDLSGTRHDKVHVHFRG